MIWKQLVFSECGVCMNASDRGNWSQVANHTFGDLIFECHENTHDRFLIPFRSRESCSVGACWIDVSISPFSITKVPAPFYLRLLLLLLSRFSRVWLCATPQMAAHQAPPSLGFSRQEHWSGLPFPSPKHESEKSKWSRSVVSDSSRPYGLQPTRLLRPWDFPGKSTGVGCHCPLCTLG